MKYDNDDIFRFSVHNKKGLRRLQVELILLGMNTKILKDIVEFLENLITKRDNINYIHFRIYKTGSIYFTVYNYITKINVRYSDHAATTYADVYMSIDKKPVEYCEEIVKVLKNKTKEVL